MAEVFDLTSGELLLFARRFARDASAAEDLVQQTFVRAIERAAQFDEKRRLLPWLTAILANEARMVHRREQPDAGRLRERLVEEPPQEAERREAGRAMDAAFADLPPAYRDVVAMRLLHGMQPRHIAAALAIPVATVKTRLRRGVQKLAASLPHGLTFAAAVSLLAGRGMAATRQAVLVRTGAFLFSTSVGSLLGHITMKKLAFVLVAALLLLVTLPLWSNQEPPGLVAPTDGSAVPAPMAQGAVHTAALPAAAERTAATAPPEPATPRAAEEVVAVDLFVRAVWNASRQRAARVPLVLLVQSNDCLGHQWTDSVGEARFVLSVPAHHWSDPRTRSVSVTTPLMPGRFFNLEVTAEPGTLEVELDDGQHVSGTVVDAAGTPVASADVRLLSSLYPEAVVARSDAGGAFELAGLPIGWTLRASIGAKESAPATIADLGDKERLVLRLDRDGDLLQVRVVAADGQPIADATVRLDTGWRVASAPRQFVGSTDAQGFVAFAGLPADAYVVEVVHRAHPPAQRRITTEGLDTSRVETIVLGGSATLVGIVRRGSRPANDVRVWIGQATSLFYRDLHVDRDARFTAELLAVGTHELFFAGGAMSERRLVTLREGEQRLEFELPGGTSITGRLLFSDGSPAPRWTVAAQRTDEMARDFRTVSGADGRFACENLPAASYSLVATGPDGGGHTFFGIETNGRAIDYRLPETALWRPASIVGRVQDPPSDATLWLSDENGNGGNGRPLAAGGAIELGSLTPGRHRLWLEHDGIVRWLTEVELASGQVWDLGVVQMPRSGSLVVALRSEVGVDPKGAHVLLRSAASTGAASFGPRPQLRADGAWHCEHVPSGTWWILVGGDGIAPEVREVFVEAGSTGRIAVDLAPAVPVVLRFTADGAGASAVGWRREIVRRTGDRAIVHFREVMGRLETRLDLLPGSFTIEVDTGGGFHGTAAFDVPTTSPVEVPLLRR